MSPLYGSRANTSATDADLWTILGFDNCGGNLLGLYIWASFALLFSVVGFPASVVILHELFKTWRTAAAITPNNFFMVNFAIMDAVFLLSIPLGTINYLSWKIVVIEMLVNGLTALNTCGRPLLMACTCVDCYVAVVHPVVYHRRKSLLPRAAPVAIVWTLTVVSGFLYCFSYRLFYTVYSSVYYITVMVVIVIFDGFIIRALLKSDPGQRNVHPQKQRAIHILVYSLLMSVISYLPPALLYNIGRHLISDFEDFMCIIGYPVTLTSILGSAVMPLLFLHSIGKLNCVKFPCWDC